MRPSELWNAGKECWAACGKADGACPAFCGPQGLCCRAGWVEKGCDGKIGGKDNHQCAMIPKGGKDMFGFEDAAALQEKLLHDSYWSGCIFSNANPDS